jgi:molybdopterin-guanine dinucleotide biosynthesis protein A
MNFEGSLLIGAKGTSELVKLVRHLDQTDLCKVNSVLGVSFSIYRPWMSLMHRLELACNISSTKHIVPSASALEERRSCFKSISGSQSLAIFDERYLNDTCILNPKDQKYGIFLNKISLILKVIQNSDSLSHRLNSLINEVLPQDSLNPLRPLRANGSGLSSLKYRKGILLSLPVDSPVDTFELALNLAHEMGHQALMTYQIYDDVIRSDHDTPIYSVVRQVKRPAILSFHAMIAVLYMLEFIDTCRISLSELAPSSYIEERRLGLHQELKIAIRSLSQLEFTPMGGHMMKEAMAYSIYSERAA